MAKEGHPRGKTEGTEKESNQVKAPSLSLPKGGGAIRGMGEKFAANPITGTGSFSIPMVTSPGRSGFGPQLSLSYDSGAGNGHFGLGWQLSLPAITRKTDKGLPQYRDAEESDVFILSGAEDLVPVFQTDGRRFEDTTTVPGYLIHRYRPRIEGLFARIERWTSSDGEVHWRSISKDNITTLYGKTAKSRIFDPAQPNHIFSWLIGESYDDKGNVIVYEYLPENSVNIDLSPVHEKNRTDLSHSANRYLKRIRYGNYPSRLLEPNPSQWLFEVVFDYGEHHPTVPKPNDAGDWLCRPDPFSSYRAGFEIRTYRRCHRVLMFHHFPDELGREDYLVRSTELTYEDSPIASFITAVTQSGYVHQPDNTYLKKSLPPLEFKYSQIAIQEEIREIDAENLPYGLDGSQYQWVDLDGEGLSGILTEQAGTWFYKPNWGGGRFGPLERVATQPSLAALGQQQLLDLAGNGQLDLVLLDKPTPGFFERTLDRDWEPFIPFAELPNIPWHDPNLRFVDLNGDGHADVLITESEVFTWYPSLAERGFGPAQRVQQARDEEAGPHLVFADGTQSIYLADLSGDGLTDLVRIRNGEVCYWPNLGYGHFGAKVTMDNAPWFDRPDQFDQKRIRLADIDGSGTTDILYLAGDGVHLYFNQSGNRWSAERLLTSFPPIDNLAAVQVLDLFGNGTACLLWSSPLPAHATHPMRYIDLMGGQKPHLLISMVNNLGAETRVQYTASTQFYLADKAAGTPWITRLPFPVHVVEHVETYDRISRNRFVTRYAYHHGYFDGEEREFRGFARVEQWDTEEFAALSARGELADNLEATSHVPPVLTKTWFHTGAYLQGAHIALLLKDEYYQEPHLSPAQQDALLLPDTVLPAGLTAEEEREACRALKGSMLRQEIYALDDTDKAKHPYTVTEQNFTIEKLQSKGDNRHAVFFTHPREAINYHYERNPADPRVNHALTLAVDEYGNVLQSVAVGYGRRLADSSLNPEDQEKQTRILLTYTENNYTNPVLQAEIYRTPLPCEARTYELLNVTSDSQLPDIITNLFRFEELQEKLNIAVAHELPYEGFEAKSAVDDHPYRRLIEHVRTRYRRDDLTGPLPLGQVESLALPYESYQLAFTPGLLTQVYGDRVTDTMLADEGKYYQFNGESGWWIPAGQVFYALDDLPAAELNFARQHFFLPQRFRDPFGTITTIRYDRYDLAVLETEDALHNKVTVLNDYRVLQPYLMTDPNGNHSQVAFDALGLVVGTAVIGKNGEGDSLTGFVTDLEEATVLAHLQAPLANPHALLQQATTRLVYDLFAYVRSETAHQPLQPAVVYTLARETHVSDLAINQLSKIQHSFSYSDGFGREIQKKIQAEPDPAIPNNTQPRWVGSGWTIFNNKGKPVRQYEPFFSATHGFEFGVQVGVSPILFYDPVERVVATLHPNHTYEKVVFDPWQQSTYDVNDTVLSDPRIDPDISGYTQNYFASLPTWQTWYAQRQGGALGIQEQTAANQAAVHANTPTVAYFDTLGRPFLTVADNGLDSNGQAQKYPTRVTLDIEGNQRAVQDAQNRLVMRYDYDLLSHRIHQASMEAGERWSLNEVTGKPLYHWDSRGHTIRTTYDELRRPVQVFMREDSHAERLVGRTVYGETQPNPELNNLRGKAYQGFDSAGVITSEAYDFKGNLLHSQRQLAKDYKNTLDWSQSVDLETEIFNSHTSYDALNRPVTLTTPDQSVLHPIYNEANLLEQVTANLRGAVATTVFVQNIDYDAKGQRTLIEYGNGVKTFYDYDPLTFRLIHLQTQRGGEHLQNLFYTYDPVGNITHLRDEAQQTIYFNNTVVEPHAEYTYDALYRLIAATGREHIGQVSQLQTTWEDADRINLPHPHDGQAMRRYTESYEYDAVGNFLNLIHQANNGDWTRHYTYAETSLLEPGKNSNRLTSTTVGNTTEVYPYDAHGNMTAMSHLARMDWDFKDQLQQVDLGGGGTAFYVYDAAGQRVRKVIERQNGTRQQERIYLGGFEIYREYNGDGSTVTLERETLHIMDDKQRIALVETRTQGEDESPKQLIRYQFSNHLGSASLELDDQGRVISYEEYYPYGSTAYQGVDKQIKSAAKRYRYTGKERDKETGLNYHSARYYIPWIGCWLSADPLGIKDSVNCFSYAKNNPILYHDKNGKESKKEKFEADWIREIAIPILLVDKFEGKDIPLEKRLLILGHSRGETLGQAETKTGEFKQVIGYSVFNYQVNDPKRKTVWINTPDYQKKVADPKAVDLGNQVKTPYGTKPRYQWSKDKKTLYEWNKEAKAPVTLYDSIADATTTYLGYLKSSRPGAIEALKDSSKGEDDFYKSLLGYGKLGYGDLAEIKEHFKFNHLEKDLVAYAKKRLPELQKELKGEMDFLQVQKDAVIDMEDYKANEPDDDKKLIIGDDIERYQEGIVISQASIKNLEREKALLNELVNKYDKP
jgi:RHS repeat-associated protein